MIYRSYEPIDGSYVDLIARENNSVYYKNNQGMRSTWLNCRKLILSESAVILDAFFQTKKHELNSCFFFFISIRLLLVRVSQK